MKKLLVLGIILCCAMLALPALSEQADAPADQPAQPAQAAPVKAKVKAVPVKAAPAKAVPSQAGTTEPPASEQPPTAAEGETAEGVGNRPTTVAGFVEAMTAQIEAVGGRATCDEQAGRCRYHHRGTDGHPYEVQLWYGEPTSTIYIFVNNFATAGPTNAATPVVVRHLAAMSRSLGIGRFEWNETDGEIRVSTVMNVDTNFDEHALRSLLRFVQDAAERLRPEVTRLLEHHENAPSPARPPQTSDTATISDRHGYMQAIEDELRSMGFNPTCVAENGRCTFELDSEEARNVFNMAVRYDSQANTVLVSADRFLSAPTENPRTDRLLQRMMSLNWQQLVPMFQWDPGDGAVRVVGALSTDSNLDRKAFRSVVASVNTIAARHYRELRGMLNP